jgi:hypothetical protein
MCENARLDRRQRVDRSSERRKGQHLANVIPGEFFFMPFLRNPGGRMLRKLGGVAEGARNVRAPTSERLRNSGFGAGQQQRTDNNRDEQCKTEQKRQDRPIGEGG